MEAHTKKRVTQYILINFFSFFTFWGFGTLELYYTNSGEFWFTIGDVFPTIAFFFGLFFVATTFFLLLIPCNVGNYIIAIIWGVALALYIQGNFLPNDYGSLNGEAIIWENHKVQAIVNTLIWIMIVIATVFAYKKKKEKFLNGACVGAGIIIATQISTLIILGLTTPLPKGQNILSEDMMFTVSDANNIIVFVLDAFDSGLMEDLLDNSSDEIEKTFEDFSYYPNTVGGATRTRSAIPYILVGQPYIKPVSYANYLKEGFLEAGVFDLLSEHNYDVRLLTESAYVDTAATQSIHNLSKSYSKPTSSVGLVKDYLKLTAFRYAPHIAKKFFWMYSGEFAKWQGNSTQSKIYTIDDVKFNQNLMANGIEISGGNAFRFYHLHGAHAPYTMNRNREHEDYKSGTETEQALGALNIVEDFIIKLKEKGVYDSSTIIVMADHGIRGLEQNPLFMMKPRAARQSFQKSEFPLSYSNLQEIFRTAIEAGEDFPENYIEPSENRFFYIDGGNNNEINITEYVTMGRADDVGAFVKTGNIYHGDTVALGSLKEYKVGTNLFFNEMATANAYCVEGFSKNEGTHTWTENGFATMNFKLEGKYDDLQLDFLCFPYRGFQRIKIYANDHFISEHSIDSLTTISTIIPKEYVVDNELKLKIEQLDAVLSPEMKDKVSKKTGDGRMLGLQMYELSLTPIK